MAKGDDYEKSSIKLWHKSSNEHYAYSMPAFFKRWGQYPMRKYFCGNDYCGTIDDLKSIARERARFALANTSHLQNSEGAIIAMGISGDDYHLAMVLLAAIDRGGAEEEMIEITHSTTIDNFEECCFTLLQKISVFGFN